MSELAKEIISVDIEKELKTSYLDYAMSVIIGRALPDVRDGLKPVHRRALYAMHVLNNDWNKPYKKSARVVGDIIGKYHPHGDAPAYEAIVRMAQSFSLRYPLIDGQGNFSSIDGDSPAAMRYTEIRLARITHELLEELDQETVDFVPNYDGAELIPEVLPARLPNLLINGSSGIAVGMATNIPPHNLVEVIDGCLAYLADPNISIEALMAHIPGPDFPTAAIINGRQGIEEAYRTGRGRVVMRSRAEIERDKQQRETIIVHELPYQVNKARLIEKIAELVKEKKIEGISALRDESDREGMRVVIEIKRDAMADIVLNNLYTQTPLQTSFGVNMVALHQGQPKLMALKDILQAFISHRREVVSRRTLYQLRKTRERAHILEGLAVALTNIDSMIQLIRQAQNATEAKRQLLARDWVLGNLASQWDAVDSSVVRADWAEVQYGIHAQSYRLSPQQAQAILEMRLHKLTGLEHEKLLTEYRELLAQVSALLANLQNIDGLVQEELIAMKTLYPDARRTEIISSRSELQISDLIAPEEVIVTLSHYGYVKYQLLSDYEAQRRGGKGRSATPTKADDFIEQLLVTNTHDTLLCFSSRGRLYWLKVYELPQASRGARGKPIVNLLPLESAERITAIFPVRDYPADRFVLMATALGTVKKIALSAFSRPRSSGLIALNLKEGDELIGVNITEGQDAIMLFSAHGKVVYFPEDQVRDMGRSATGVRGMQIAEQDRVVSLIVPRHQGQILTVTANGFGKRTPLADYPMKSRATQGVISIKVTQRNGCVVGAVQVEESDQMMLITDAGTLVRLRISEVNCIGRNTHGVRLIRTATAERVAALQRIAEIEVDEESA